MGSIGLREILLLVLVILILFGAKRIPELARGMGRGIREFKDGMRDTGREEDPQEKPKT
jgi:sec-independent protein translocase protein TatA